MAELYYLCRMYQYNDKELGVIIVKPNARAKRIIVRRKADYLQMTVPKGFNPNMIGNIIDEMRPGLKRLKPEGKQIIDDETVLQTLTFSTRIVRTDAFDAFRAKIVDKELMIYIPDEVNLKEKYVQDLIKEIITDAMRHEAKRVLIHRTYAYAERFGLKVNDVKISKSVTRWGSCSAKGNINLSLFLMLLPQKYIDYVILHELAHTVEMNHSIKFWSFLDTLCGEDSKALSNKVRLYKSPAKQLLMI